MQVLSTKAWKRWNRLLACSSIKLGLFTEWTTHRILNEKIVDGHAVRARMNSGVDNVTASQTISSGREFIVARNAVTISATSFIVNNSARVNISSNNEVVIRPGATFSPTTTNAYVNVIASRLCN